MKNKKTKKRSSKRPSKFSQQADMTVQDTIHLSSEDITRQRTVLTCEAAAMASEIASLQHRINAARAKLSEVQAKLFGLSAVISDRFVKGGYGQDIA